MTPIIICVSFAFSRIFVTKKNRIAPQLDVVWQNEMHFLIQHNEISNSHLFWFLPQKKKGFFGSIVLSTACNMKTKMKGLIYILHEV
jgi:hypothetical protein